MTTPQRIQLRRTKGWRKPDGAISVARPTRWGNPFTIMHSPRQGWLIYDDRPEGDRSGYMASFDSKENAAKFVVKLFRKHMFRRVDLSELRGHDLACWCPLEDEQGNRFPCHADVLLDLANRWTP